MMESACLHLNLSSKVMALYSFFASLLNRNNLFLNQCRLLTAILNWPRNVKPRAANLHAGDPVPCPHVGMSLRN